MLIFESNKSTGVGGFIAKMLGSGILGIIVLILLSPFLIVAAIVLGIYLLYIRWKMKRAMKKMAEQFQEMSEGGSPGGFADIFAQMSGAGFNPQADSDAQQSADDAEFTPEGRKKIHVKVRTVKTEPDSPTNDDE